MSGVGVVSGGKLRKVLSRASVVLCWCWCTYAYTPPARRGGPARGGGRGPPAPRPRVVEPLETFGMLEVPHRLGVSAASWGDEKQGWKDEVKKRFRTPEQFGVDDISAAYNVLAQKGGLELWEVAAGGPSSKLLGQCAAVNTQLPAPRVVARCAPSPLSRIAGFGSARAGAVSVRCAVERTTEDLGTAYVDVLLTGPATQKRGLGSALGVGGAGSAAGRLKGVDDVGVANIAGGGALRKAHAQLEARGLRCVACAVDFNLVDARVLRDGTLQAAKELDMTVLARSPLCMGLASGKYTANNPTGAGGFGATPRWRYRTLATLAPLHDALAQVASQVSARRTDEARQAQQQGIVEVTTTQVALHWLIAKGAVPLPAIKNEAHALELLGCRGWVLNQDEVDLLDDVATYGVPYLPARRDVNGR